MAPVEISLTIPGSPAFLRLARLAAADAAVRVGMTGEEAEDLRIAVDELCYSLSDGRPDRSVELTYRMQSGAVEVLGRCAHEDLSFELSDLARTIVGAVVGEFHISREGNDRRFQLRKAALVR